MIHSLLVALALIAFSNTAIDTHTVQTLRIETAVIETIKPHLHSTGDSLFDHSHHIEVESETVYAPEDLWVTNIRYRIKNAPASVLHHANLHQSNGVNNTCPGIEPPVIVSIGEDVLYDDTVEFPRPFGYFIEKGSPMFVSAMIHNPEPPIGVGGTHENVSVQIDLDYQLATETDRSRTVDFYMMHLDEESCVDSSFAFTVPPDVKDFVKVQNPLDEFHPGVVVFPVDGEVIYAGAHTHGWEGGKQVLVYKNNILLETYNTRTSAEDPRIWETDHGPVHYNVKAGDLLHIEAVYDNPSKDQYLTGAMGSYGFFFAPAQEK